MNCNVTGRIASDIETKTVGNDKLVTSFSVAEYVDKENSNFWNCQAWGQTGEFIKKHLNKGDKIAITCGQLSQQRWEKDGEKKVAYKLTVKDVDPFVNGSHKSQSEPQPERVAEIFPPHKNNQNEEGDEMPF